MVGACFVSVGAETVKLTDLVVTGYEKSDYYLGEMGFTASFQRRASNGMPYATYMWVDESQDMENWDGGKWFNVQTGDEITATSDVTIAPGEGFWATAPELQGSKAFYFVVPKVLSAE